MADLVAPSRVSDFLLCESRERGEVLTNLKLQKLVYYAQAWQLAYDKPPLFSEDFQAWVHGPVLPSQYHRFRDFRWLPITAEIATPNLPSEIHGHLSEVIDVFGTETAVALEIMTHREAPWLDARGNLPMSEPSTAVIPKDAMARYYKSLL